MMDYNTVVETVLAFQAEQETIRSERLQKALNFTLRPDIEGGYSDVKHDRGGSTYRGITQKLYDIYQAEYNMPPKPVKGITDSEIENIAFKYFWVPSHCDDLPIHMAIVVFDSAFHSGPKNAVKFLQAGLQVTRDGDFGPNTLEAVKDRGYKYDVIERLLRDRESFLLRIIDRDSTQEKFRAGWLKRIDKLLEEVMG